MKLPHIVRVHKPARFVESPGRGPCLGLIADVPLAEDRRTVSARLESLADGGEFRIESAGARADRPENFGASRIAAAQQGRSRSRTDGLGHVEVMKCAALAGKPFHVRRSIRRIPEWMKI